MNYKKGFTLVETMVAIAILMLAILGPLSIASSGLRSSQFSKDQITAYYLAQEGIEYARYERDDNYILNQQGANPSTDWLSRLSKCEGSGCELDTVEWFKDTDNDPTNDGSELISPPTNNKMYENSDGDYTYTPTGNTLSKYSRTIVVTPDTTYPEKEANVTVTMNWTEGSDSQKTFSLSENIFNIYEGKSSQ